MQVIRSRQANTQLVVNEVPGGSVNSSNTVYTTASTFATNSLRVTRNGVRLKNGGADFTENATTNGFTMVTAPSTGDVLLVDYNVYNSAYTVGTNSFITQEIPAGSINSSNAIFTTARAYIAGSLIVYKNRTVLQGAGADYTETTPGSGIFTFTTAPATGDTVFVGYQYNLNPSGNSDTVDGIHANATPTAGQLYPLSVNQPIQIVDTQTGAVATGTTVIPSDDTIPQNTEGDQYMSVTITPKFATSKLIVEAVVHCAHSVVTSIAAALFQDAAANAIAADSVFQGTGTGRVVIPLSVSVIAGGTTAITFKLRAGGGNAGTFTLNGTAGGRIYGGTIGSYLKVTEVLQ